MIADPRIEVVCDGDQDERRRSELGGSDADTIGAWPEKHIPGTQLGPNRNGRKW
jgi:Icc protein